MADVAVKNPRRAGRRSGGVKLIIIIAVVVVVLLAGGFFAVKMFMPGLLPGGGNGSAPAAASQPAAEAGPGVIQPLQPFIVNLVDPTGKRYLKVTLSLELDVADMKPEVDAKLPQIRDSILILLSSLSFDDIRTIEGKTRLRSQIVGRTNAFLTTGKIRNVYFSEFVVQ